MTPRVRQYVREAEQAAGLPAGSIDGSSHRPVVVRARYEVIRRLFAHGFSYSQIARWLGRHHTTVMRAVGALS